MKLLMIYCRHFAYTPTTKTIDFVPEKDKGCEFNNIQTAFIQIEEEDMERESEVAKKLLKNLKWICGKNDTNKRIILHSFAHLSESKATPEFTQSFFNSIDQRLSASGFEVTQTPFGYFLNLQLDAPGFSLARVFKSL
ncbi:MAG: threonyl-tRNA synthetase editing domain-containing protein [Bacteroidota bacterium]|nr:threonyl-tRNA synthetase editing domain-containing protein [Bacteroidota bacterium]